MKSKRNLLTLAAMAILFPFSAAAQSVHVGELTWTEVREKIDGGTTTVIIPTGGTEQNGPHMVLGKHNFIIHYTAGEIAKILGNTLVAPVMAYVPEGNIDPPSGAMRMPGSITLPNEPFMAVIEWTARSFHAHGFKDIILIGDSGGNQRGMAAVADKLNAEWAAGDVRVHHIREYYDPAANGNREWLEAQGYTREQVGGHAGIMDTSQLWAIDENYVRPDLMADGGGYDGSGASGNASFASPAYGRQLLQNKIQTAVRVAREKLANR
jgi:creatinine amidohydrolase